jgi:hypothetical protein
MFIVFANRVTRAKRHCCVICDSETVSQDPFLKNLIAWIEKHGDYHSAVEFIDQVKSGNNDQLEGDLLHAEVELAKLFCDTKPLTFKGAMKREYNDGRDVQPNEVGVRKESKEEERQKDLLFMVNSFAKSARPGEEMALGSELTSFDRLLVHKEAETLGIGHRSEGVDGVDRRIILSIISNCHSSSYQMAKPDTNKCVKDETEKPQFTTTANTFDSSSLQPAIKDNEEDEELQMTMPLETPSSNDVLKQLASDRQMRQKQAPIQATPQVKSKSKKARKLGGTKMPAATVIDAGVDELDDLAFLDAQINNVQNSHGRKVDGKGSYKTTVNGILLTQRSSPEKKVDVKKSAALQLKLKQAQDSRKPKEKNKK